MWFRQQNLEFFYVFFQQRHPANRQQKQRSGWKIERRGYKRRNRGTRSAYCCLAKASSPGVWGIGEGGAGLPLSLLVFECGIDQGDEHRLGVEGAGSQFWVELGGDEIWMHVAR